MRSEHAVVRVFVTHTTPRAGINPLATQEKPGVFHQLPPSPKSHAVANVRHALRMVAHRASALASRPAASRRIRRGYLRYVSSYAIWLAAAVMLINELHARVMRWSVEMTMAQTIGVARAALPLAFP